ncbi:MAG: hypothetical protein Q8Q35_04590 [Nanoarchaeota archaeon]|nr:hypothetical protein [Nanoarchaeota archaeon]
MKRLGTIIVIGLLLLGSFLVFNLYFNINETYGAGEEFVIYINSDDIGNIAVKVSLPDEARYSNGAPILVVTNTFFTPKSEFDSDTWAQDQGFIRVSYLWPGTEDVKSGVLSEGENDYGGNISMQAYRDVILFALGEIPDYEGNYITDLSEIVPLTDNVGLYAFSHPGIAATNVLAFYSNELNGVKYFVGRENPTIDKLSSVEVGHYQNPDSRVKVKLFNPFYDYIEDYSSFDLDIDYSNIKYNLDLGRPFFDINEDGLYDEDDFLLGDRTPEMFGKKYYSVDLIQALVDNEVFSNWPSDLATLDEVQKDWPLRETTKNYDLLTGSSLKVMLIFAKDDHVQVAEDKPHIHQAFDGFFKSANLWVRLNPDKSYVSSLSNFDIGSYSDNNANIELDDWRKINELAYQDFPGSASIVSAAGVAEMADRVQYNYWADDLDRVLE